MATLAKVLQDYAYTFPKDLLALSPARPRDSARLLVYDRSSGELSEDTFKNLAQHLPKNAVLVFNQTKVIPARFEAVKPTGGKVSLLYVETENGLVQVLANKKLETNTVLASAKQFQFVVVSQKDSKYALKPKFPMQKLPKFLEAHGLVPLPPYLRHSPLTEKQRKREYQTIFSKTPGAVAAPTASLHFTKSLLGKLKRKGISFAFVTLHVGLGTFAPITEENIRQKQLHTESYSVNSKTATLLNRAKSQGRPIIAVGTTVVRTLESASNTRGTLVALRGTTDIFIQESTKLRFVSGLITNFHVPSSSLLMLVAAFVGRKKLLNLYKWAIKKKFRLFSFGDGMLIK